MSTKHDQNYAGAEFRTTHWSIVLDARHPDPQQRGEAIETLCRTYWYPVYAFLRRQGQPVHDAQDLAQGFFVHLLERETFMVAERDRGRFRSFLLGALKNFLASEQRRLGAWKRGGRTALVAIDPEEGEEQFQLDLTHDTTPEKLYQRSWADTLLARTLQVLREDYERAGKQSLFETLEPHLSGEMKDESYPALSRRTGLSVGAVTTSIYRMRRRYAELLRREIAQTVESPEEIDGEITFLFAALGE